MTAPHVITPSGPAVQWRDRLAKTSRSLLGGDADGTPVAPVAFANGDVFEGEWQGGLPEGRGVYTWTDGSSYEGEWRSGKKHGHGVYSWPSGACYQGEWQDGCMHGLGTFHGADGSRYTGGWEFDLKHGLGRKVYGNGDVYEGVWRRGKPHGPGRYMWADNNEYDGEWCQGRMHGTGTFAWKSGERYDGDWKDGLEDGVGVLTFKSGSQYQGFWQVGHRHSVGVYHHHTNSHMPAPVPPKAAAAAAAAVGSAAAARAPSPALLQHVASLQEAPTGAASSGGGEMRGEPPQGKREVPDSPVRPASALSVLAPSTVAGEAGDACVHVQTYRHGALVGSVQLPAGDMASLLRPPSISDRRTFGSRANTKRRLGIDKLGQVVYKDNPSYDLMLALQLGIRHSVLQGQREPRQRPAPRISAADFAATVRRTFPRAGGLDTPVHPGPDFLWKDYAPRVFSELRELAGVAPVTYVEQLASDQSLRLLASPGKSGSVFFLSADEAFMAKTIRKAEFRTLQAMLPAYYRHLAAQPNSLLCRFYGLHRISSDTGGKVRFIVMANIFPSSLRMHKRFDLKGSLIGRTAGPDALAAAIPATILKDLDIDEAYKLEEGWHTRLVQQLRADCDLLARCGVMDYSMLLGVHYRDRDRGSGKGANGGGGGGSGGGERLVNFEERSHQMDLQPSWAHVSQQVAGLQLGPLEQRQLQQLAGANLGRGRASQRARGLSPTPVLALRPLRDSRTLRPLAGSDGATDDLALSLGQARVQLGLNMAATAVPRDTPDCADGGRDVVLFFGIIDTLTLFDTTKRLEAAVKALSFVVGQRPGAHSAVPPRAYSRRFQAAMLRTFV